MVNTRFNISKGLYSGQIVRPARVEKPRIKFIWPKVVAPLLKCFSMKCHCAQYDALV